MEKTNIYQLRDYQILWINQVINSWKQGNRSILAQLPTGAGKTICFVSIASRFLKAGQGVLVIAHRIELIEQAVNKLSHTLQTEIGIIKYRVKPKPHCLLQVASIQTISQKKDLPENIGLVIIDEAHHATTSSYRRVLDAYPTAKILGVTATPKRLDGQGFKDLFDDLVIGVGAAELISRGYLSSFKLFATDKSIDTTGITRAKIDFVTTELALAVNSQIGLEEILNIWKKYANGEQTVIFAASVEHSRSIADIFRRNHIKCEHLDSDTPPDERASIVEKYRDGKIQILTNYQIISEGFDVEGIGCVLCVRPTISETLWLQMLGRALRPLSTKKPAILIDLTDNWKRLGLPDEKRKWSLEPIGIDHLNKEWGLIKCTHCTHIFRPLSDELKPQYSEIKNNGTLLYYHLANCPSCGQEVEFQTSEHNNPHYRERVKIKTSIHPEIKEIDLTTSTARKREIYNLIISKNLKNAKPAEIYKAIYMTFIEKISEFTLGDWRAIVALVEPEERWITKKAYELYVEGLTRHKNRLAALAFREKNRQKELLQKAPQQTIKTQQIAENIKNTPPESTTIKPGIPLIQKKYAQQWQLSLQHLAKESQETAHFLQHKGGLFAVEKTIAKALNITIEVWKSDEIKCLKLLHQEDFNRIFSNGFNQTAKVMFRLKWD